MGTRRFNSLRDYLASTESSVDGLLDSGWGAYYPVKGREVEATVLFADITGFSTRTANLAPVETLAFVQNFFAWITAEALHGRPGIVDKYIGDEVMVVFSTEFGSDDPFADAVRAGAAMSRNDHHAYQPHIGIASGPVIVGYAGTPFHYDVSVFGAPVAKAARCAAVRPPVGSAPVSSTIVVPEHEWAGRDFLTISPPADGLEKEYPIFEVHAPRDCEMKGLGTVAIREIYNTGLKFGMVSAEDRAVAGVEALTSAGRYWAR